MDIKIRAAEKNDYGQVEKIMQQVQALHIQWNPDIYKAVETVLPEERFLENIAKNEALVAEAGGNVVGILIYTINLISGGPKAERKVMHIHSIGIDENYRGKGVGQRLLSFAEDIYRKGGFSCMELSVNAKNTGAKTFYEKCGFTEKKITMELI